MLAIESDSKLMLSGRPKSAADLCKTAPGFGCLLESLS